LRYYITDRRQLGGIEALMSTIESALSAGVEMIQIREKDLPTRELMALVSRVLSLADLAGTKIFINDRVDVAVACAAHGVHLPGNSIAPRRILSIVPPPFQLGVSCHSVEEVRRAEEEAATFAVFGPVFATGSKQPLGLDALREAVAAVHIPVLALGGISGGRIRECLDRGAAGIAGISLFQTDRNFDCHSGV